MGTLPKHHHGTTRAKYPVSCGICGAVWPRDRMFKDGTGLFVCPDEGRGRDRSTLDKINASVRPYRGPAPADAPVHVYSSPTNPAPNWEPGDGYPVPRPYYDLTLVQQLDATDWEPARKRWGDEGAHGNGMGIRGTQVAPTYVTTGSNPYLQFTGTQDLLLETGLSGFNGWTKGAGAYVALVVRFDPSATLQYIVRYERTAGNACVTLQRQATGEVLATTIMQGTWTVTSAVVADSTDVLVEAWMNIAAQTWNVAVNGTLSTTAVTSVTGLSNVVDTCTIGSRFQNSNFLHGRVYEVNAYDVYDASKQSTLRARVAERYGLSL